MDQNTVDRNALTNRLATIGVVCLGIADKSVSLLVFVLLVASGIMVIQANADPKLATPPPIPVVVQPFPDGTLLPLLQGELALRRKLPNVAARQLIYAARLTRSVDVARRAAYVAQLSRDARLMSDSGEFWVGLAPTNPVAYQYLALALARQGKFKVALNALQQELEYGGGAGLVAVAETSLNADQAQQDKLITAYHSLLGRYSHRSEIAYGLALIYYAQNNLNAAQMAISQALATTAGYRPAQLLQVKLLRQQQRTQEALTFLKHQLQSLQQASPGLLVPYGQLLLQAGQLEPALEVFQRLLIDHPNDTNSHYMAGVISLKLNMPHEALEYFATVLRHGYDDSNLHYFMGRSFLLLNQTQIARQHFLRVDSGARFMDSQRELLQLHLQDNADGNVTAFFAQRRLALSQASAELYYLEADINLGQKNIIAATMVYNAGLNNHPDDIALLYGRAMLAARTDKLQQLEIDLRRIIELQPDHAVALNALGYTLAERTDRLPEARQLILKAYQINPSDPATIDSLGWLHYKQGDYQQALVYLQQAFDSNPDAEIAAHLGVVRWALGDARGAYAAWNQILQQDPENTFIQQAITDARRQFPND